MMTTIENGMNRRRQKTAKILALIIAFLVLVLLSLGPMYLFRVAYGISLDAKGPEGEIWLLIIGGGLGCGAAYFAFYSVLTKFGGFDANEVDAIWNGRKK